MSNYAKHALVGAFPYTVSIGGRWMVTFSPYFDESGTHKTSEVVALGGFISTPRLWEDFVTPWREALKDFGIEYFHMAAFTNKADDYKEWCETLRQPRFNRLAQIVMDHTLFSFAIAVSRKDYAEVLSDGAKEFYENEYGLLAQAVFVKLGDYVRKLPFDAHLAYVFESGAEGAGAVLRRFQILENDPYRKKHFRLLSIRFENKRQFVPLQASDILAYEAYRQFRKDEGIDLYNPRMQYLRPISEVPGAWGYIAREQLVQFDETIPGKTASK